MRKKMNLDSTMAPGINIPMVVASIDDLKLGSRPLLTFISKNQDEIKKQLNQYGAILFRGFSCDNVDYFSQAIELCGLGSRVSTKDYEIARTLLPNEIYTSSDLPGSIFLPLHHEKPRSKNPPHHVYFCCATPALLGGGTILADAYSVWMDMPKKIQDKIVQYGVTYKQFFHGKTINYFLLKKIVGKNSVRTWAEFYANDKAQIEKKLMEDNLSWSWINKGKNLIVTNNLPGRLIHPVTNKPLWFNVSGYLNYYDNFLYGKLLTLPWVKYLAYRYMITKDLLPIVCHYGNGQPFKFNEIVEINQVLQNHTCVLKWQKGDFIIVDNFTFMHGKQAHQGDRLLYSCMTMRQEYSENQ